jgi:hypothetical protein
MVGMAQLPLSSIFSRAAPALAELGQGHQEEPLAVVVEEPVESVLLVHLSVDRVEDFKVAVEERDTEPGEVEQWELPY